MQAVEVVVMTVVAVTPVVATVANTHNFWFVRTLWVSGLFSEITADGATQLGR